MNVESMPPFARPYVILVLSNSICALIALEKDGFGSNPIFTAFVATTKENDHEPIVGYAIYYFSFSTYQGELQSIMS